MAENSGSSQKRWWVWVLAGIAIALVLAIGITAIVYVKRYGDLEDDVIREHEQNNIKTPDEESKTMRNVIDKHEKKKNAEEAPAKK